MRSTSPSTAATRRAFRCKFGRRRLRSRDEHGRKLPGDRPDLVQFDPTQNTPWSNPDAGILKNFDNFHHSRLLAVDKSASLSRRAIRGSSEGRAGEISLM